MRLCLKTQTKANANHHICCRSVQAPAHEVTQRKTENRHHRGHRGTQRGHNHFSAVWRRWSWNFWAKPANGETRFSHEFTRMGILGLQECFICRNVLLILAGKIYTKAVSVAV